MFPAVQCEVSLRGAYVSNCLDGPGRSSGDGYGDGYGDGDGDGEGCGSGKD